MALESLKEKFILHHGDAIVVMKDIPDNSIDMVLTSPPYDDLRTYNGSTMWTVTFFKTVVQEVFRVLTVGGVCVWVVGDAVHAGSETGTSFKQALTFLSTGFYLHDTMIYGKRTCPFPSKVRYNQSFEYMFVFSKGAPKTVNLIKDRSNITSGRNLTKRIGTRRQKDGSLKVIPEHRRNKVIAPFGVRENIWYYKTGIGMHETKLAHKHPATFPLQLCIDHIQSWSNSSDIIMDIFMGSGTAGVAALNLDRKFIGIEHEAKYFEIARQRIDEAMHISALQSISLKTRFVFR